MSTEPQAYSTDNPDAVAAYRRSQEARAAFARRVCADAAQIGKNAGPLRQGSAFGGDRTVGLAPIVPADRPGGRVFVKSRNQLEPKRGKAGDAARQRLKDHQPPAEANVWDVLARHGLPPNDMLGEGPRDMTRFGAPAIFHVNGEVWALYRGHPGHWMGAGDEAPITWTPRKLSEYYAAREATEANAKVEG